MKPEIADKLSYYWIYIETKIYFLIIYIYIYIKMNRSANEFVFGILGFYGKYLCSTRVSNFIVLFRRLIVARVVSASSLCREDCFDRSVILFLIFSIWVGIYKYLLYGSVCLHMCVYMWSHRYTYILSLFFLSSLFLFDLNISK